MKTPAVILLVLIAMIAAACGDSTVKTGNSNGQIKTAITPIADSEMAIIELEKADVYGSINSNFIPISLRKPSLDSKSLRKKDFTMV